MRMLGLLGIAALALGWMPAAPAQAPVEAALKAGDLVFVNVHREPEFSVTTQLDDDGNIAIPHVGKVTVGGLTPGEASGRVAAALTVFVKNPRVQVSRSQGGAMHAFGPPRTDEMKTRVVPLQNSNAEVLFNALNGMASGGGSVSFDPDTNSLIITDSPETLENMLAVVEQLDGMQAQVTQVRIEAKIVEVEKSAVKEVGVRWFAQGDQATGGYIPGARQDHRVSSTRGFTDPTYQERIDSGNYKNTNTGTRRFIDEGNWDRRLQIPLQIAAPGQFFFGFFNAGIDLGVMLDALAADDQAEVLAAPYTMTVNHQKAHIEMTEKYPVNELSSTGLTTITSTNFVDVGIMLDVTPHVRRDPEGLRYVQLELAPEVSSITGLVNGVPVRSVRGSKTIENVRDGQTLVIGGIVQSDSRDVKQGVPGLGNLPLLGRLFSHTEASKGTRELMIFVTPTVFDRPEEVVWGRMLDVPNLEAKVDLMAPLDAGAEARKD